MWKKIRVSILLLILFYVSVSAYKDLNPNWDKLTTIVAHPININKDPLVQKYIDGLKPSDFDIISQYLSENASNYREKNTLIHFTLGSELKRPPPLVNEDIASNPFSTGLWSLKFKLYSLLNRRSEDWSADTIMYLIYHHSKKVNQLERSTALQRGRIALVNLYGETHMTQTNNVIIAHEALHTFGAKDFYDTETGIPIYPIGFAEPNKKPLYPQNKAEIMGGYILLNEKDFYIPDSFAEVVVNKDTARDVKWIHK